MNIFLKKLIDALYSGADYDLRELAFLAGIELETAKEIANYNIILGIQILQAARNEFPGFFVKFKEKKYRILL
jgi:hypothetical protein